MFPRFPQVAVDPMECDEVDRERLLGRTFERKMMTGVCRRLNKLKSANSSVRCGMIVLQPSPGRISRVANRPQTAGRI